MPSANHRLALRRFTQLPQRTGETWQCDLVRLPMWVDDPDTGDDARPFRPTGAVWVSARTGHVHIELPKSLVPATPELAVVSLFTFASREAKHLGGRPSRVEVRTPALRDVLVRALEGTGTAVALVDRLDTLAAVMQDFVQAHDDGRVPPALSGRGVTVDRMRSFADAAAVFFRAQPWRLIGSDDVIAVEAPKTPPGMGLVSMLGKGGEQFGIAFFPSRKAFRAVLEGDPTRVSRANGVTFCAAHELPFADLDLWEDEALPLAGPAAYPLAADLHVGADVTRPNARALAHIEALLRALAVITDEDLDSGRWTRRVEAHDGPVDVTLTLPELLEAEPSAAQLGPQPPVSREQTPLERAQDLAFEAGGLEGRRRTKLARQALALSEDCVDAWMILAEDASSDDEAVRLYEQALTAGVRIVGPERMAEWEGQMWAHAEARPYLSARLHVAEALFAMERDDQALDHYRALLRLTVNDNQGVRYLLLSELFERERDDEAGALLEQYRDDVEAMWPYGRALWLYRTAGDSAEAQAALMRGVSANPFVPLYLVESHLIASSLAETFALGSREEAAYIADVLLDAFEATPGALEWLRRQTMGPSSGKGAGGDKRRALSVRRLH